MGGGDGRDAEWAIRDGRAGTHLASVETCAPMAAADIWCGSRKRRVVESGDRTAD